MSDRVTRREVQTREYCVLDFPAISYDSHGDENQSETMQEALNDYASEGWYVLAVTPVVPDKYSSFVQVVLERAVVVVEGE